MNCYDETHSQAIQAIKDIAIQCTQLSQASIDELQYKDARQHKQVYNKYEMNDACKK